MFAIQLFMDSMDRQSINVRFLRAAKTIHSLIVSSTNSLLRINICSYVCKGKKMCMCVCVYFWGLLVDRFSLSKSRFFFSNTILVTIPIVTFIFVITYTTTCSSTLPCSRCYLHFVLFHFVHTWKSTIIYSLLLSWTM